MTRKELSAQHPPMYLYNFLQKLAPLGAAQVPETVALRSNELVYAWGDRKAVEKYAKDLPEKGEYFLLYAKKEDPLTLFYRDVTPQVKYLDSLKTEMLVPLEDEDCDLLEAALFEAAYLFDLLKALEVPELFAPLGGFPELEAAYSGNELKKVEMPVLVSLESNPLNLEIFMAQTKFFFAQYIRSRFCEYGLVPADERVLKDFDDLVRRQLEKSRGGNCWKSRNFTGIENLEFDCFVQQLELLITLEPEKVCDVLCPGRKKLPKKSKTLPQEAEKTPEPIPEENIDYLALIRADEEARKKEGERELEAIKQQMKKMEFKIES